MTLKRLSKYDVFDIEIPRIWYDSTFNCRGDFSPQSVMELAESIGQQGLTFPVVVQPIYDVVGRREPYDYRLLAGHRRFKAVATFLKWTCIPASIREGLSDFDSRMLNFTENLERKDLNVLEEARTIAKLFPEGVSLREAAKVLKRDTRFVHVRLRLLKLPDHVQQMCASGRISLLDVESLARLTSPEEQIHAAETLAKAKGRKATKPLLDEAQKYQRAFRQRKSKADINAMISEMLAAGIEGMGPRVGAWCAGYIADEELRADIAAEVQKKLEIRQES